MKILMVAFGSAGDVLPLIHVSKVLQRQGLEVFF